MPSPSACRSAAAAFGLVWLVLILGTLLYDGIGGLSLAVFTEIDAAARAPPAACSTPSSAAWS